MGEARNRRLGLTQGPSAPTPCTPSRKYAYRLLPSRTLHPKEKGKEQTYTPHTRLRAELAAAFAPADDTVDIEADRRRERIERNKPRLRLSAARRQSIAAREARKRRAPDV